MDFEGRYKNLNDAQRAAVDTIDGPVMVIAGPGTGKTELLSMRVANILRQTDGLPENILCLTFTESGASNMRERLTRLIGQSAHKVNISTYHGFGGDLIRRFPEYFSETRLQEPIDELGRHQVLTDIVEKMSYLTPLKQTRHHLGDLIGTISEVKRALLTSDALRTIAAENAQFLQSANQQVGSIFADITRMPTKLDKALPYFEQTLVMLESLETKQPRAHIQPLANIAADSLRSALTAAVAADKTKPLTEWKNKWLAKNANNEFIVTGELENRRIFALADVVDQYQEALEKRGLYDFDDMIIRSIQALTTNDDLRYTLQEKYQYLLLDEFQDTNAVQLRLVQLLTDNPVHEGRPNVLAVGDDDQAIYAFQGAQYSNMLDFYAMYRDVTVINLTQNYRSHADVLQAAQNVAEQIGERLHHKFDGMTKTLAASNGSLPESSSISRNEFLSDIAQYDWVAKKISELIKSGVSPKEIAILAPKHKQLEPVVPYLNALDVPVRYEKRENILEAPVIKQIIAMSRLILAVKNGSSRTADSLWPEVLSYDFWKIPTQTIWQLAWKVTDSDDDTYNWNKAVLEDESCREAALLILTLAGKTEGETLETMLDLIIGTEDIDTHDTDIPKVRSPLREYYAGKDARESSPQLFYETLSHLKVLREKLRDFQKTYDRALMLGDLVTFVDMYHDAEQQIINTSPYNQDANAVQIMTVFKAKGLEYEHVFLVSCSDDVWGSASRGNSNKLTLPPNLAPIRHAGATDDERLRILFVALTRAKFGLYLTSYTQNYSGKSIKRLAYFDEQDQGDNVFHSMILPPSVRVVRNEDHQAPALRQLDIDWHTRHADALNVADFRALLEDRLATYRLSPTHLNSFTDLEHGGPENFFYKTILRFPEAPSLASQFGSAMHDTMEWIQHYTDSNGSTPAVDAATTEFAKLLQLRKLPEDQEKIELERGEKAIAAYLSQQADIFKPGDKAEHNFYDEAVFIDAVHMSGKIDRMEIDKDKKEIVVVDYKTGKAHSRWESDTKLHKYKQQLYCYKLLIENSRTYAGYTVTAGRLEFLEPDQDGLIQSLPLAFDEKELERIKKLLNAVWHHVHDLSFPDIAEYPDGMKGVKQFEDYLLDE